MWFCLFSFDGFFSPIEMLHHLLILENNHSLEEAGFSEEEGINSLQLPWKPQYNIEVWTFFCRLMSEQS